jgi:hypothetical protein
MKRKILVLLFSLSVIIGGYFLLQYAPILTADKSWIHDLGYKENEIHDLSLNKLGCPEISVKIPENQFPLIFDTGNNPGFLLTNLMEEKINYITLGKTEQLNRDGSHRGWAKSIRLNKISVFGKSNSDVDSTIADWDMFSSEKFNGIIGLKYFSSQVITLDYTARKIAVSSNPIDYNKLSLKKYVVLPLLKSNQNGQNNLLFFKAILNGKPISVYLDTGKNHSYIHNKSSSYIPGPAKPDTVKDATITLDDMELPLKGLEETNLAQVTDLPYPLAIELNSDQIIKNNLLVTIDLIDQKIIFRR